MQRNETYAFSIVKKPIKQNTVDQNLTKGEKKIESGNADDETIVTSNQLKGTIALNAETTLHSFNMRASQYSTFNEKINAIRSWKKIYAVDVSRMSLLGLQGYMSETFDQFELNGNNTDMQPLVFAEAARGNKWLDNHVFPQVYEYYGTDLSLDRDVQKLGTIPLKGMKVLNEGQADYRLQQSNNNSPKSGEITVRFYVPAYVYRDFSELRNKAANRFLNTSGSLPVQAQRLLMGRIDDLYRDSYLFKLNYRLPGNTTPSSSKELVYEF